ncbi:MAG TPA: hypothetical protein PKC69_04900 [Chitinophagaceae bacterium]|nr:hypothetical protein [Chitinophagaceae bacterium]
MIFSKRTYLLLLLAIVLSAVLFFCHTRLPGSGSYTRQLAYEALYAAGSSAPQNLDKWKKLHTAFSDEELKKGKELTQSQAGVSDNDAPFEKLQKIGRWLRSNLDHAYFGQPSDEFEALSVIDQYQTAAASDTITIWCGTYGRIMLFFSLCNDLDARGIETINQHDHHVVNETYIPEMKQWVLSDIMLDAVLLKDQQGKYLNAADLLIANARGDSTALLAASPSGDNPGEPLLSYQYTSPAKWAYFLDSTARLHYYYTISLDKVYSTPQKIKRYIYPSVWYDTFSLKSISNKNYFTRLSVLYGTLLCLLLLLLSLLNDRSKKHTENLWRKSSHQ